MRFVSSRYVNGEGIIFGVIETCFEGLYTIGEQRPDSKGQIIFSRRGTLEAVGSYEDILTKLVEYKCRHKLMRIPGIYLGPMGYHEASV